MSKSLSVVLPMDIMQAIEDTKEGCHALELHVQDPAVHTCKDAAYVQEWHASLHVLMSELDTTVRGVIETVRTRFTAVMTESAVELDRVQTKMKKLFSHKRSAGQPALVGDVVHGLLEAEVISINASGVILFITDGVDHYSSVVINVLRPPVLRKACHTGIVGQVISSGIAMNLGDAEVLQYGLGSKLAQELGVETNSVILMPVFNGANPKVSVGVLVAFNKISGKGFTTSDEVSFSHTAAIIGRILNRTNATILTTGVRFKEDVLDLGSPAERGTMTISDEYNNFIPKRLIYRGNDKETLLKQTGATLSSMADPTSMIDVGAYVSQLDLAWLRTTEQYTQMQREDARKHIARGDKEPDLFATDVLVHPHPNCDAALKATRHLMHEVTKGQKLWQRLGDRLPDIASTPRPFRMPNEVRLQAIQEMKEVRQAHVPNIPRSVRNREDAWHKRNK